MVPDIKSPDSPRRPAGGFFHKILQMSAAVLFWIAVWWIAVLSANRHLLVPIPTPADTAAALLRMASSSSFWLTVSASLVRILVGFTAAFLTGTALAFLASRFPLVHILLLPMTELIRAIPVASFTILIFLWVGRNEIPSFISFFTVFPIIYTNIENGAKTSDRGLIELARVFGLPRRTTFLKITLPGIRPFFLSALTSGLGFAFKSGVAAEIICRTSSSLGDLLWSSKSSLAFDEVFAETLMIVLLSALLQLLARRIALRGERGIHD